MKTPHTPEPWPADMRGITFAHGSLSCGYVPPDSEPYQNSARAVQCVNALAGVEDPAKAIEAAISILKTLSGYSVGVEYETGPQLDAYDLTEVQQALQLLTPKP